METSALKAKLSRCLRMFRANEGLQSDQIRKGAVPKTHLLVDVSAGLRQPHQAVGVASERSRVRRRLVKAAGGGVDLAAHLHQEHHALQLWEEEEVRLDPSSKGKLHHKNTKHTLTPQVRKNRPAARLPHNKLNSGVSAPEVRGQHSGLTDK